MTQSQFIAQIRAMAVDVPGLNPEAAAAHAAVESAYGSSLLATEYRALFGIKATGWDGAVARLPTWEVVNGKSVEVVAEFRAYDSWADSIADYGSLIRRVYPWAAQHSDDPVRFLVGLFALTPRYATDPNALAKSVSVLDRHKLLAAEPERLGRHEVIVDNAPTLGKALTVLLASVGGRPAVYRSPHNVTRSRRPDGSYKIDLDRA